MSDFYPELPEKHRKKAEELRVFLSDIEESFVVGGGKGGQKINKTANCVHLRHRPSGVEVRCQKYRERSANRLSAHKLLVMKIEEQVKGKESERKQKIFKLRKQKKRRSKKAKEKMLEMKRQRSEIKKLRKNMDVE